VCGILHVRCAHTNPTPQHTHTHTRRPPPCNTFDLSRLGLRVSTFCVVCCCVRSRIRLADIFLKALALSPCLTFNQHSDSTHSQRTFLKSVLTCVQDRVKRSTDRHDAKRRQVWDRDLVRRRCALRGCQPRTSWHTRCAFFSLSFHFQFCLELFDFFYILCNVHTRSFTCMLSLLPASTPLLARHHDVHLISSSFQHVSTQASAAAGADNEKLARAMEVSLKMISKLTADVATLRDEVRRSSSAGAAAPRAAAVADRREDARRDSVPSARGSAIGVVGGSWERGSHKKRPDEVIECDEWMAGTRDTYMRDTKEGRIHINPGGFTSQYRQDKQLYQRCARRLGTALAECWLRRYPHECLHTLTHTHTHIHAPTHSTHTHAHTHLDYKRGAVMVRNSHEVCRGGWLCHMLCWSLQILQSDDSSWCVSGHSSESLQSHQQYVLHRPMSRVGRSVCT
jgi:hypothetical protein